MTTSEVIATTLAGVTGIGILVGTFAILRSCLCRSLDKKNANNDDEKSWNDIEANTSADSRTELVGPDTSAESSGVVDMSGIHHIYSKIIENQMENICDDDDDDVNALPSNSDISSIPHERRKTIEKPINADFTVSSLMTPPLSKSESTDPNKSKALSNIVRPKVAEDPLTIITSPRLLSPNLAGRITIEKKAIEDQSPSAFSDITCDTEEELTNFTKQAVTPCVHRGEDQSSFHSESLTHSPFTEVQSDDILKDKDYKVDDDSSAATSIIFPLISSTSGEDESCSESILTLSSGSKASMSSTYSSVSKHSAKDTSENRSMISVSKLENPASFLDSITNTTTNPSSQNRIDKIALECNDKLANKDGSLPDMTDSDTISWDLSSTGSCDKSSASDITKSNVKYQEEDMILKKLQLYTDEELEHICSMENGDIGMI